MVMPPGFDLVTPLNYPPLSDLNPKEALKSVRQLLLIFFGFCFVSATIVIGLINMEPLSPTFDVVSGHMTNFTLAGRKLSSAWAFEITAKNPNSMGWALSYSGLTTSIMYDEMYYLSIAQLRPMIQPGGNLTAMRTQIYTVSQFLNDEVYQMMEREVSTGFMEFQVEIAAKINSVCHPLHLPLDWTTKKCSRIKFKLFSDVKVGGGGVNGTMVDSRYVACDKSVNEFVLSFMMCIIMFMFMLALTKVAYE